MPGVLLVSLAHGGSEAKSKAFLSQERVATIAAAVREDLSQSRVVGNQYPVRVTGPRGKQAVTALLLHWSANTVNAAHKVVAVLLQLLEGRRPQAVRHDAHAGYDVRRISQLHAKLGEWRVHFAHTERNDVHAASCRDNKGITIKDVQSHYHKLVS